MTKEIDNIYNLLSSKLRIMLCLTLNKDMLSLLEIMEYIKKNYKIKKSKEAIYRALENMVNANLVEKTYDQNSKKLKYSLKVSKLEIDFQNKEISLR